MAKDDYVVVDSKHLRNHMLHNILYVRVYRTVCMNL